MRNIKELFEETVAAWPGKPAIRFRHEGRWKDITRGEFIGLVKGVSGFLGQEGIRKGDKIGIVMKNRPEWPAVFLGAVSEGAVCVPIDPGAVPREIENIVKDSGCVIVFTDDSTLSAVKDAGEKCPSVKKVISVDSEAAGKIFSRADGLSAKDAGPGISPEDIACILYTSGTTGGPKGIMLSHGNLTSNCDSIFRMGIITAKDSVISVLPLHHTYPLTVTMLLPLLYGGEIIYPASIRPEDLAEAMRAGATVFVAVPQILSSLHGRINAYFGGLSFPLSALARLAVKGLGKVREKTGVNLPGYLFFSMHAKFGRRLRFFVSGGAKLDENVTKGLFSLGFSVLEGYGLTEASPVLTFNPPARPKAGSVGVPIPHVEIGLADKDEKGVGEVIARGPNVMKGYYKREDLTGEAIKDGWLHTGDLGYVDKDGYLYLTGRIKEVIVLSSGVNVYPNEVEEAYMSAAPVKEMCVFDVPAKKGGEETRVLWAVAVPDLGYFRKYGEVNLRDVIRERFDNVSRTLPSHMRLMGFSVVLEDLPRTLLGKVKRFEVKGKYASLAAEERPALEERELSGKDLEMTGSPAGRMITEFLKKQTGIQRDITPSDLLELDLGIDSLGRIELISGLEALFGTEIGEEIVGRAFSVRDLIEGIRPLLPEDVSGKVPGESAISGRMDWKTIFRELPKKENLDKLDLSPGFRSWLGGFLFVKLSYVFFRVFYDLKVDGQENVPSKGPFILYVNHTSYFDGPIVGCALPGSPRLDIFFVGFRPYFNVPVIRSLIKVGRIIPLDFSSHLIEAMRSSYYVLSNGRNLCLFPEGLRTLDGKIGRFKKGFGILAKETGAKLVPVVIEGAFEAWPRTSRYPERHPIRVKFGQAEDAAELAKEGLRSGAADEYEAISAAARQRLAGMKDEG